jgi:hypothetical protein
MIVVPIRKRMVNGLKKAEKPLAIRWMPGPKGVLTFRPYAYQAEAVEICANQFGVWKSDVIRVALAPGFFKGAIEMGEARGWPESFLDQLRWFHRFACCRLERLLSGQDVFSDSEWFKAAMLT